MRLARCLGWTRPLSLESRVFYGMFPGELTAVDRVRLESAGAEVYEQAGHRDGPPIATQQVVRLSAGDADEARARIARALGHEPDGLRIRAQAPPDV